MEKQLTAIIEREGDGYVSLCPELDIASQGGTIEEARITFEKLLSFSLIPLRLTRSSNVSTKKCT